MAVTIYALLDPRTNEVRYVGKTNRRPDERLYMHRFHARRGVIHKDRWLRELLALGLFPAMRVLADEIAKDRWPVAERWWIEHYRKAGAPLTNISAGGEGIDAPRTEEWRRKIGLAHKGRPHPWAVKLRLRVETKCAGCGNAVYLPPWRISRRGNNYCSKKCLADARREAVRGYFDIGRAIMAAKKAATTHCPRGHQYTLDNLVGRSGRKNCKTCHRERMRRS